MSASNSLLLIGFVLGFALGYAARELLSRHRRTAARRDYDENHPKEQFFRTELPADGLAGFEARTLAAIAVNEIDR
jgi:hypothetical protein